MPTKVNRLCLAYLLLMGILALLSTAIYSFSLDLSHAVDPRLSYWWGSEANNPYLITSISLTIFLLFLAYGFSTAQIGATIILMLFPSMRHFFRDYGPLISISSGYPFGILVVTAINRIITLLFPNIFALPITVLLIGSATLFSYTYLKTIFTYRKLSSSKKWIKTFIYCPLLFIIIFIFQLHTPDSRLPAHIIGDSALFTIKLSQSNIVDLVENIPLFDQHYDELLFLYPFFSLIKVIPGGVTYIMELLWLHYSVTKYSIFILLFLIGITLKLSVKSAILVVILCFFGGVNLFPLQHQLLFDSHGPIAYSLHPGRVVINGLFISFFMLTAQGRLNFLPDKKTYVSLFIFSIGLGALSISSFSIFVGIIFGLFSRFLRISRLNYLWIIFVSIAGFYISAMTLDGRLYFGYLVIPSSILLIIFIIIIEFKEKIIKLKPLLIICFLKRYLILLVLITGFLLSIFALGNLFISSHFLLDHLGQSIIFRSPNLPSPGIGLNPFCGEFPHTACVNAGSLINAFGLPVFIAALVSLVAIIFSNINRMLIRLVAFTLAAFILSLWVYLFLNPSSSKAFFWIIWFKSRLVEPFFYGALFTVFAVALSGTSWDLKNTLSGIKTHRHVPFFGLLILVYIFCGLIADNFLISLWNNLLFIKDLYIKI